MTVIFLCIALGTLALAIALALRARKDSSKCISYLTIGMVVTVFLLVLPTRWAADDASLWNRPLYSAISALFYGIKTLGGGQSLDQLESIRLEGWVKNVYMALNYVIVIAAPLLTSGLILSFIGDTFDRVRYFFTFTPKCYVFSELNDNTIAIARGMCKEKGRKAIVFCGTKGADKALLRQARDVHGILLYLPCTALSLHTPRRVKEYEFNLLSDQEDRNIEIAEDLIARKEEYARYSLTVNAFVHSATNIHILESMMDSAKDVSEKQPMRFRFIDEISLFCCNLLYRNPLCDLPPDCDTISVLIVGCGVLGTEMLKTALWNGQVDGCKLKIRILDKDADSVRQQILAQCPELCYYDLEFLPVDAQTPAFEDTVNACADATFICVATGSDELNIRTAERVYQIFHRRNPAPGATPPIYMRVRNTTKAKNLSQNCNFLTERNIHAFGTVESIFSECTLFHSELENLAYAVHLCYENVLASSDEEDYDSRYANAEQSFYASAYNRRSSMAVALHIPVKLRRCGIRVSSLLDLSDGELREIEAKLKDDATLDKLARNEHARWNAFMRSEGHRKADIDTMCNYASVLKSHKDGKGYQHPCIVSWEELDTVQEAYDKLGLSKKNFKASDYDITRNIPEIIRAAKKLKEGNLCTHQTRSTPPKSACQQTCSN